MLTKGSPKHGTSKVHLGSLPGNVTTKSRAIIQVLNEEMDTHSPYGDLSMHLTRSMAVTFLALGLFFWFNRY